MRFLSAIVVFILTTFPLQSQTPGLAYQFNGQTNYARLSEVFKGVETMEFWIKPLQDINKNSTVQPILVRDQDGQNFIGLEEFALFFEDTKNINAGKLAFRVGDGFNSATIFSDSASWKKDSWYHIAVLVSPVQGLKMYINGVLQQETNSQVKSVYYRSEGSSGEFLLGKWEANGTDYLAAQIEDLRFWSTSRSQTNIRKYMCQDLGTAVNLKYTMQFNTALANQFFVGGQSISTIIMNGNINDYKKSNAPIGESSVNLYAQDFTGLSLSMFNNYKIKIDSILTVAQGVHIYHLIEAIPPYGVLNRGQFGVWFTYQNASYNVEFDYSALSGNCDSCSILKSRDHQLNSTWTDRQGKQPGCFYKLFNESSLGLPYREEYRLLETLIIESGLPDTANFCSNNTKFLTPNNYPGAIYIWNDTIKTQSILADKPGLYTLDIYWHGCHIKKSVWVKVVATPIFYLPKDTTICEGDTLWLTAPIDSADYLWIGFFTTRTFGIVAPGTYNLKITKGGCTYVDEITVDVIYDFHVSLDKDTILCLGEGLNYSFSGNGIDYLWSDGDTQPFKEIFNTPGTYWVKAWNGCFEKADTVQIDYVECECRIFLANAFTPNGDDNNEIFKPITECYYEEFELEILNRWGEIIFRTTDVNFGWDGTYKGKDSPQGQYNWRMRFKKYSWMKKMSYEYGDFILIR